MRTARCSSRLLGGVCPGWESARGVSTQGEGVCLDGRGVCLGVYAWGCLLGMCLPRGVTACHGVYACQGRGCVCLVCPSVQAVFACQGGVCLVCPGGGGGGGGDGGVCLAYTLHVHRILDTCLWKHYLSATSFVDGKTRMHSSNMHTNRCSGCH